MSGIKANTPHEAAEKFARKQIEQGFVLEALYAYRNAAGDIIHYWRIRCKHPDGRKWVRPMHLDGKGVYQISEPLEYKSGTLKPLYGLPLLTKYSQALVWVLEGEKCVDALNTFFGSHDLSTQHVAVTSGSATSATGANWQPLRGRNCRIWPDNSADGLTYARTVQQILRRAL